MSVQVQYRLLTDQPTQYADGSSVAADWAAGKIYQYGPYSGTFDGYIWTNNATTGALISAKTVPSACVISSNTFIVEPSFCVGADHNLYGLTTRGSTSGDRKTNLRVSKFSPAITELAAIVPASIALDTFSNVFDFNLLPFRLNGVNYLFLALTGWCGHCEIINADTMVSVATFLYTNSCNTANFVIGEQPNSHTQRIYCMAETNDGSAHADVTFTRIVFDASGPSISDSTLGAIGGVDIDATWSGDDIDPWSLMFCPADNSLIFAALNDSKGKTRICKFLSGAIAWSVQVSSNFYNFFNAQYGLSPAFSDLSAGTLIFIDPRSTTYYTINLATGAATSDTSPHFDGTNNYGNAWFGSLPSPFATGASRLLYYYDGNNDYDPAVWSGGWAVFGFDPDPEPPPPGLAVSLECPPPGMDGDPIVVTPELCQGESAAMMDILPAAVMIDDTVAVQITCPAIEDGPIVVDLEGCDCP